ncbi:FadR/GntR family transcriptional regulator [Propionibacterium australiense]|uniref:FCD domain-containing protein n=1 Tax=Propionibacterium australiense TaxID=119981 RepID=A0A383S2H4_9ACTN|nr:FadR/GntR family transcriptional regulator [Propionibacterium australiense]RLP11450.1 FCD domain-containing protein [Propionibacterium australiense]RLP12813.1 FCD domain-containing protein [Propionibacterium australiense]SYZ32147.1 GntR bacterial regulatory protein HTH signature [Propionibacterium australiense]VEH90804.1 L-lactate utilization operon repressor [Propionibacterium australiense]
MTALHRSDPRGLGHALADQLKHRIAGGELGAGERLPSEAELCRDFAVSRTVVREAVAQLRAEGLVETFQGRGTFVTAPGGDPEPATAHLAGSPRHVMELRLAVECEAAALAATRGTEVDREVMRRAMADLREALARREPAIAEDFAVHAAIALASGNPLINDVLRELGPHAILRHRAGLTGPTVLEPGHADLLVHEHQQICDAIVRGDPDASRAAMRAHLARSLAALDAETLPSGDGG